MSRFDDIVSERMSKDIKKILAYEAIEGELNRHLHRTLRRVRELEREAKFMDKGPARPFLFKTLALNRAVLEASIAVRKRRINEQGN